MRTQSQIQVERLVRLYTGGDWEIVEQVDLGPEDEPITATSGRLLRREAYKIRDRKDPDRVIWCGKRELQRYAGIEPDGSYRRDYLRNAQRVHRARRRVARSNVYRSAFVVDDLPRKSGLRDMYVDDTDHVSEELAEVN